MGSSAASRWRASAHLVLVGLGLGLDGDRDHRLREDHRLQDDRRVLAAERVPGGRRLEADGGGDVAGPDLLDVLAVVGVHLEDAADPLALPLGGVVDVGAALQGAAVDPEEGEVADEGVVGDLEGDRGERLVVVREAAAGLVDPRGVPLDRGDVERRGQVVDDRVQHRLHAAVLERGAAEDGHQLGLDGPDPEPAADVVGGQLLPLQVAGQELVVGLGHRLQEDMAPLGHLRLHRLGDRAPLAGGAEVVEVDDRGQVDQVDHPDEVGLAADGKLDGNRVGPQPVPDRLHGGVEVGPHPVHLVDEADPRHLVAVGLPPDRLGLGLDPGHRVEHGHRAVEHPEAALHLHCEVHMPGRIDDVDTVAAPLGCRGGRGDGDPALLLLDHPVHGRGALVDLAHPVDAPGVEEDALGRRGLARVDVGHDPDVPVPLQGDGATGDGSAHELRTTGSAQYRKCEKALLDSAILWVSSFRLTEAPTPLAASISSAASRSAMLLPERARA